MITENFSTKYRSIATQRLTKTLLIGLVSSALLHTVTIAGISYWAHNNINDRDQIDIVEIERVELEQELTPSIKPIVKQTIPITQVIPTSQLKVVKSSAIVPVTNPMPVKILIPPQKIKITKSAASSTSPLSNIISSAVKPILPPAKVAISIPQQLNPATSFPSKLFSNSAPSQSKIADRIQSPKVLKKLIKSSIQKGNNSTLSKNTQSSATNNQIALPSTKKTTKSVPALSENSNKNIPITGDLIPSDPDIASALAQTPDRSTISGNNQAKSLPESSSGLRSSKSNTLSTHNESGKKPEINPKIVSNIPTGIGGGTPVTNGQIVGGKGDGNPPIAANSSRLNSNGNGDTHESIATENKNQSIIECLKNCEIRYPEELANSDIGKDKILVRVTIDPNGLVASTEIVRSSGNQKLDQFTLDGIKQMQLNSTGKTRTHRIKISTLLNN